MDSDNATNDASPAAAEPGESSPVDAAADDVQALTEAAENAGPPNEDAPSSSTDTLPPSSSTDTLPPPSSTDTLPPPSAAEDAEAEGPASERTQKRKRRRRKKRKGEGDSTRPSRPASDRAPFHVGEEVFGRVTAVLETAIMADLSGKALAIFDRSEMEPDDLVPAVGDRFVARVHNDGARGGLVVLTRKPLREEEAKPLVEQAAKDGNLLRGLVTGAIKGGVEVDIGGLRAFAPASGMDLHPANANLAGLVGKRLDFKVLQYTSGGRDLIVTRRPMLEAEAHERRKHALSLLEEGQVMNGVVRTVVEWGAFVALSEAENLEGLVHISEASHDPRARIEELFKPGDELEVKITKIDEKGKIWLSRKALLEDPWGEAKEKYAPGKRVTGKITRLEPFGAFVELEEGLDGLIHVADLSMTRIEHPEEVLKVGQDCDVVVHSFDYRSRKIALHPAPPPEQADEPRQKVTRGATVKAEVIRGEGPGVVVRLLGVTGRAARGFIPAGQTGTSRGTDLRKHFRPGSVIEAKIVDVDPRRGEPKLSIRGLKDDEERRAHKEYRQKLKAEGGFGTLGDLFSKKLNLNTK